MTRRFEGQVVCPKCGHTHTAETAFERWMRNERGLDSIRDGIVRFDLDLLLHRYKRSIDKKGIRDIQCMMFIEIKTFNAPLKSAQRDTLSMLSQALRNRRRTPHTKKQGLHLKNHCPPTKAYSRREKRDVVLWMLGGHLLTLSGDDPVSSESIMWDETKPIDIATLIELLRFDRYPDGKLEMIDWRRRYSDFKNASEPDPTLF